MGVRIVFVGAHEGAGEGATSRQGEVGQQITDAAFGAAWGKGFPHLEPELVVRHEHTAADEVAAWGADDDALDDWLLAKAGRGGAQVRAGIPSPLVEHLFPICFFNACQADVCSGT